MYLLILTRKLFKQRQKWEKYLQLKIKTFKKKILSFT